MWLYWLEQCLIGGDVRVFFRLSWYTRETLYDAWWIWMYGGAKERPHFPYPRLHMVEGNDYVKY